MARTLQSTPYVGTSTTFDNMLSVQLDKRLGELIPNMVPVLKWLKSEKRIQSLKNPSGNYVEFGVELRPSSGFGPHGEGDTLRDADQVDTVKGKVYWRKGIAGRIELTSDALNFGRASPQNLADVYKQEYRQALNVCRLHAIPGIWGDGTGLLAKLNGGVTSDTTVTVDGTSAEKYNAIFPGTRWLFDGMKVISVDGSGPTINYDADTSMTAAVEISSVDSYTQFTVASNISATDNFHIVEHHCSDTSSSTEKAKGSVTIGIENSYRGPHGFLAMCDDGTRTSSYLEIDDSTYPQWKANIDHNSGTLRALSTKLFYKMFFKLTRKSNTFTPDLVCWMNPDVHINLVELLEPFVEFKPRQLDAGYKEFDVMINSVQIPIKLDHGCAGGIFMLSPRYITFLEALPLQVWKVGAQGDGWRDVSDKLNVQMKFVWRFQIYTTARNRHGLITDLNYTAHSF